MNNKEMWNAYFLCKVLEAVSALNPSLKLGYLLTTVVNKYEKIQRRRSSFYIYVDFIMQLASHAYLSLYCLRRNMEDINE